MRIVLNDANILIDLVQLDLLHLFANLDFELYTTDFVLEEINAQQRVPVDKLVSLKKLSVIITDELQDYIEINNLLEQSSGLSFEDCSVWYYSKRKNGVLLSGDAKLRKLASNDGVEVKGVIFVFDEFVKQNLLLPAEAATKLGYLKKINPRLPRNEIDKRIMKWENR